MSDCVNNSKPTPVTLVRKDGTIVHSYGAARGYSWKPFGKGNMANLRHGAYSERIVSTMAAEIQEEIFGMMARASRSHEDRDDRDN